jgi:hypothetical protein
MTREEEIQKFGKPKAELNIYEQRLFKLFSLMKIGLMLKNAKIKYPKT